MMQQSLLDMIAEEMGCTCLSDLHFLMDSQRKRLHNYLHCLESNPVGDFSKDEWDDAITYITAEAARQELIE